MICPLIDAHHIPQVVASAEDLADLDARIRATGEDPQEVWLERIEFRDDSDIGGAELFF